MTEGAAKRKDRGTQSLGGFRDVALRTLAFFCGLSVWMAESSPSAYACSKSSGSVGVNPVHSVVLATVFPSRGAPVCAGGFHFFAG